MPSQVWRIPLRWIWFVGSGVWLVNAAIALHYNHVSYALGAMGVSGLFLATGFIIERSAKR